MTKYDCSSGDLNPIGSISKQDLKKLLGWAAKVRHLHHKQYTTFNASQLVRQAAPRRHEKH